MASLVTLLVASPTSALAQRILVQSTFDASDEGWTQVDLDGDYRYILPAEPRPDCPGGSVGMLTFCDPDAGEWMFDAPAKFFGDKSAALDGYIEFSSGDWHLDGGGVIDPDPYPNIVIASETNAIVIVNANPPLNTLTSYHYALNERENWLWVNGENPMSELPRATRAQIHQVLTNITAIRIRGEAITGDDQGSLDNVILAAPAVEEQPRLSVRILNGKVELFWTATSAYLLETYGSLPGPTLWTPVDTLGGTTYQQTPGEKAAFFRLRLKQ